MLPELQGHWSIERRITGSSEASFSGYGLFTYQRPSVLNYREEGRLSLNGGLYECRRSYVFQQLSSQCLAIYFPDGCEFVRLDFGQDLKSSGTHVCGADIYQVGYHFVNRDTLETQILVTGPAKNYVIFSCFRRVIF
jgi:hypothetical protein